MRVEEEEDEVDLLGEPLEHLDVVVAAARSPLLFPGQDSGSVHEGHPLQDLGVAEGALGSDLIGFKISVKPSGTFSGQNWQFLGGGSIQGYSYDQLIGWVDLDLGSSPGWWPIL